MSVKKTYFISDIHLGARYIKDHRSHEAKIVDWLKSIEDNCESLFLVGDVLDYWYEYKNVVPKGFVRFFGQLASMCDKGIKITWLIGNHDIWIFDYIPHEIGVKVIDGNVNCNIEGTDFFISHGDAIGKMKPGYRFIRSIFRNKFCQFLYSAIHPGLTVPFAHRWSAHSRKADMRYSVTEKPDYIESVEEWAREYFQQNLEVKYIVLGHYHDLYMKELFPGHTLVILGDWIDKYSYAIFDGNTLTIGRND